MSSQVFADSPRHIINQSVHVRGSSNQRSTFLIITGSCRTGESVSDCDWLRIFSLSKTSNGESCGV